MRVLVLLLLLVLASIPVAVGQTPTTTVLLEDPSADVHWVGVPQDAPLPERFGPMDLISLAATEHPETIEFTLGVRELDPATEIAYLESADYLVTFRHDDEVYQLRIGRWTELGSSGGWANLYQEEGTQSGWSWIVNLPVAMDEDANTLSVLVPRENMDDSNGAAPFPGRSLTEFWAEGRHLEINPDELGSFVPEPSGIVDRMPDEGTGEVPLEITLGVAQRDDVYLSSPRPFRMSNGEATTFVYDVRVANVGDDADRFELGVQNFPPQWEIHFPEPRVTLDAGEAAEVRALVTVPFAHQHGARDSFILTAESATDDSTGGIELGVTYTEVPQPSGHHPRVWFHSVPVGTNLIGQAISPGPGSDHWLMFNAMQDWPAASGEAVQSNWQINNDEAVRRWVAWLSPSLGMGMDFDLDAQGLVSLPIRASAPMEGMTAYVNLWHWSTDNMRDYDTTLVFESTVEAGNWGAQEVRSIELPFEVLVAADRFPVSERQGLTMNIQLTGPAAASAADPYIEAGGYMDLPLFEFHDAVDPAEAQTAALGLTVLDEPDRFANPGDTVVFPLQVSNRGDASVDVTLRAVGEHGGIVEFAPGAAEIPAGASREFTAAIEVHRDAADGALIDLLIVAGSEDGQSGLQRVRIVVDDDAEYEDQAYLLDAAVEKSTPAPVGVAGLALLGAALARRK